ncbi:conserved hypothetical protein [Rubrobacter xylanophilus DSM 9941]|uniref:DUF501 domain-containing protein n=1 Tax=Rubrobacter xylanophilus (strain DSM 9941 / JCM 11954 / NBRC 16129 / PRD-1) TaxID=266117 RepID=Q1AXJ6_RUBXD|nr:DUF501 domain-containing protein [Rubrobacter xylanophilus]ABG03882.1 conserved hypothetical protein [Rubrobacter xylanophilus DSM 9941]
MDDREAVRRQLGREPRPFRVAARCPHGLPSVIENEPSRSMPTTFWVTCPSLEAAISRVEAAGGVRAAQREVGEARVEEIHEEHRRRYGTRVAGVREGGYVKCLHAFTALHLAGALPNPVAEWTLRRLDRTYPEDGCCTLRTLRPA